MSAVTPFEALFFFGADDVDEVDREFADWRRHADPQPIPDFTDWVTIIAVEYLIGHGDYVWFVRHGDNEGQVFRRESWMVRAML